VQNPHE